MRPRLWPRVSTTASRSKSVCESRVLPPLPTLDYPKENGPLNSWCWRDRFEGIVFTPATNLGKSHPCEKTGIPFKPPHSSPQGVYRVGACYKSNLHYPLPQWGTDKVKGSGPGNVHLLRIGTSLSRGTAPEGRRGH